MLESIKSAIEKRKYALRMKVPKHIAITTDGIERWSMKNNINYIDALNKSFLIIKSTIRLQTRLKIPILSFHMLGRDIERDSEYYSSLLDALTGMFNGLADSEFMHKNKIKLSVFGKWYSLPGRVVGSIKKAISATRDYDGFFVNFCINYDGQEEIIDAMKIIGMQIKAGRMDPELIDGDIVKENIYSSYFLPPDLMIKSGSRKETSGFLLWDSVSTKLCFTNKLWPDFDRTEFMDAIKDFQKGD